MTPKISIITPTYNRFNALKHNFDSVARQTYKDKEHVIIDNLSDDGTEELVKKYKSEVSYPVVYIREKDFGIYNAMNKGIKNASGEWIHILNSDDYYYSDESLDNFFSNDIDKFDIVAHSIMMKIVGSGDDNLHKCDPEFVQDVKIYRLPHAGVFIKKRFHELHGYYSEKYKILSDTMFLTKYLPEANFNINNIPVVVMLNSGVSGKYSPRRTYEFLAYNFIYSNASLRLKLKYSLFNFRDDLRLIWQQIKNSKKN